MYDRRIVYLFTFSIFNTTEIVQHHAFIIVVRCNFFIIVALRPVDGSEYHSESVWLIWSIPEASHPSID